MPEIEGGHEVDENEMKWMKGMPNEMEKELNGTKGMRMLKKPR